MQNILCTFSYAALLVVMTSVTISQTAFAQTGNVSTPRQDLDEVYVTARRQLEPVQKVPEQITVFSTDDIVVNRILSMRDIADLTPNFSVLDNYRPGLERFQIRGLITPQVGDPPVVFVYDGITASASEFANLELFDISQVEVLRGAQGALYGHSAIGGVVIVTSPEPAKHVEGTFKTSYGNGEASAISATLSGPVVQDKLFFRIGAQNRNSNGSIENIFVQKKADQQKQFNLKGQLLGHVNPDLRFRIHFSGGEGEDGMGFYEPVNATRASIEDFSVKTSQNVLGINDRHFRQFSAMLEQEFEHVTLVVSGGVANTSDDGIADGDIIAQPGNGLDFFPNWQRAEQAVESFTLESRLTSKPGKTFEWGLGAFHQERTRKTTFSVFDDPSGTDLISRANIDSATLLFAIQDDNTSRASAVSGYVNISPVDKLELTVAGRYDWDRRRSFDPRNITVTDISKTFKKFQPKASISYQFTPDIFLYAGYSNGFRSGGFNEYSPVVERSFASENVESYDFGLKTSFLDDRVYISTSIFRNDQNDAQITQFNPVSFTLENIGIDKVVTNGLEFEASANITPDFHLRVNLGVTDSEITKFQSRQSLVGFAMPYVPNYDVAIIANYKFSLTDSIYLDSNLSYRRSGTRSFSIDFPALTSSSHDFVDLRFRLSNEKWNFTAFVDNLFNERQAEDVFGLFNGAVELARQSNKPRFYGLELGYSF